jgi:hypothetical protein
VALRDVAAGSVTLPMVQIAPNWARVSGTVVSVSDAGELAGFLEVTIKVADITSLPKTRNLFEQGPGEVLKVLMPEGLVARLNLRSGVKVEADVRRADLHRSFVHPERIRIVAEDKPRSETRRTRTRNS